MMMNLILCRGIPARVNKGWWGLNCARNRFDAELIKVFKMMRVFSICARETKRVWGNQMKPIWTLWPPWPSPTWVALENGSSYCRNARRVQRLTLTVPSSNGRCDDLMNHTFQGARRCPYEFFLCVCVSFSVCFSLRTLTVSCDTSVESKPVFLKALSLDVAEQRCMYV